MVDKDESNLIPELTQIRKFMISYKKQNDFLHQLNENLMLSNKRLREDLEEKEVDYQKLVCVSKDILKKKRDLHEQYEKVLDQNRKLQNKELNQDAEYTRLQKRSQVLHDMTLLAEVSKIL